MESDLFWLVTAIVYRRGNRPLFSLLNINSHSLGPTDVPPILLEKLLHSDFMPTEIGGGKVVLSCERMTFPSVDIVARVEITIPW